MRGRAGNAEATFRSRERREGFDTVKQMMRAILKALHIDPYGNLGSMRTGERVAKALSPRYVYSKLALTVYEWRHPDHPWITRDAIAWLEQNLDGDDRGFEWGSGNGTAWLARRSGSLTSVEHHAAWSAKVKEQLERAGVGNADHRLVAESDYLGVIEDFPDDHFDYVLVDGLFRDRALLASIPKLRPGGALVLDNANWYLRSGSGTPHSRALDADSYSEIMERVEATLAGWPRIWTTNGVNDTAILTKPPA